MGGSLSSLVKGDQAMYRFAADKNRKDKRTLIIIGIFALDTDLAARINVAVDDEPVVNTYSHSTYNPFSFSLHWAVLRII